MSLPKPTPPKPSDNMNRESFTAFARAGSRDELMDLMRAQAEAYFGTKVELRSAAAQPAPGGSGVAYQGSSHWTARR